MWKHFFGHLKTVMTHRYWVRHYCFMLGLYRQGLTHDLSKYSWVEFSRGVRYFQGNRSPTEKERETLGYSLAWIHHKGRNRHHFEYWNDLNQQHVYAPVKMPVRYVKEMFSDRVAACRIYLKDAYQDSSAYDYFISHDPEKKMHPETYALLARWLLLLKEKGEDKALAEIRQYPND